MGIVTCIGVAHAQNPIASFEEIEHGGGVEPVGPRDERGRENARLHGKAQVRRQDEARGYALPKEIHSQGGLLDVAAPHEAEVRPGRGTCVSVGII